MVIGSRDNTIAQIIFSVHKSTDQIYYNLNSKSLTYRRSSVEEFGSQLTLFRYISVILENNSNSSFAVHNTRLSEMKTVIEASTITHRKIDLTFTFKIILFNNFTKLFISVN